MQTSLLRYRVIEHGFLDFFPVERLPTMPQYCLNVHSILPQYAHSINVRRYRNWILLIQKMTISYDQILVFVPPKYTDFLVYEFRLLHSQGS